MNQQQVEILKGLFLSNELFIHGGKLYATMDNGDAQLVQVLEKTEEALENDLSGDVDEWGVGLIKDEFGAAPIPHIEYLKQELNRIFPSKDVQNYLETEPDRWAYDPNHATEENQRSVWQSISDATWLNSLLAGGDPDKMSYIGSYKDYENGIYQGVKEEIEDGQVVEYAVITKIEGFIEWYENVMREECKKRYAFGSL